MRKGGQGRGGGIRKNMTEERGIRDTSFSKNGSIYKLFALV